MLWWPPPHHHIYLRTPQACAEPYLWMSWWHHGTLEPQFPKYAALDFTAAAADQTSLNWTTLAKSRLAASRAIQTVFPLDLGTKMIDSRYCCLEKFNTSWYSVILSDTWKVLSTDPKPYWPQTTTLSGQGLLWHLISCLCLFISCQLHWLDNNRSIIDAQIPLNQKKSILQ